MYRRGSVRWPRMHVLCPRYTSGQVGSKVLQAGVVEPYLEIFQVSSSNLACVIAKGSTKAPKPLPTG